MNAVGDQSAGDNSHTPMQTEQGKNGGSNLSSDGWTAKQLKHNKKIICVLCILSVVAVCTAFAVGAYAHQSAIFGWKIIADKKDIMSLSCIPIYAIVQLSLISGFFTCMIIAINTYLGTNKLWTTKDSETELKEDADVFNRLALRHRTLSRLWFTISLAILCGGLSFASFHVMEISCEEKYWSSEYKDQEKVSMEFDDISKTLHALSADLSNKGAESPDNLKRIGREISDISQSLSNIDKQNDWKDALLRVVPSIFVYSIFFIAWTWSLKNHNSHWHNFVTNEHRYAALRTIEKLQADGEVAKDLLTLQAALAALMPSESAYLDSGGDKEITSGERLLKFEEWIREFLTQRSEKKQN